MSRAGVQCATHLLSQIGVAMGGRRKGGFTTHDDEVVARMRRYRASWGDIARALGRSRPDVEAHYDEGYRNRLEAMEAQRRAEARWAGVGGDAAHG